MQFSMGFEVQLTHPTPEREHQLLHDCVEQAVFAGREIDARVREIGHGATAVGDGAQTLGRLSAGLTEAAQSLHQRAQHFVEAVAAA